MRVARSGSAQRLYAHVHLRCVPQHVHYPHRTDNQLSKNCAVPRGGILSTIVEVGLPQGSVAIVMVWTREASYPRPALCELSLLLLLLLLLLRLPPPPPPPPPLLLLLSKFTTSKQHH